MQLSSAALLRRLEDESTTDAQRLQIGEQLAQAGDPRAGIAVKEGIPDMVWLPVAPGGQVTITREWRPERPDEQGRTWPIGNFSVEPFYIAKYLVTYTQYQAFIAAADGLDQPDWWQGMPQATHRQTLAEQRTKQANHPRDSISCVQSVAFARWLNHRLQGLELPHPSDVGRLRVGENAQIRLPTEWEWQWAAQNGIEARPYPWGENKSGFANTGESGLGQTTAVGMYPHGAAACGALDMAGNLMEWCANDKADPATIDLESTASKALRGGDWRYGIENASCAYCDDEEPSAIDFLNGCRLVLGPIIQGLR
jgi:formylglycine-generating enzyme required for sulfatase activity